MSNVLKRLVPEPWRSPLRRATERLRHMGWRRGCNICGVRLHFFLPHGLPPAPDFLCPLCRSKPPHRLAAVYFDANPEVFLRGGTLLHVAPELGLGRMLEAQAQRFGMLYRAGDLSGFGAHHLDLLALPFASGSVTLIYCCHALNCMADDHRAMREVFRVLHPNGLAILQAPAFHLGATTVETDSAEERMSVFGDDGIDRSFTNDDYEARLRTAGFEVKAYRASEVADDRVRYHQLKHEVLHLRRKPSRAGS